MPDTIDAAAGDDAAAGRKIALPARHHMAGHVMHQQPHGADLRQPERQSMRELHHRQDRDRRLLRGDQPARDRAKRRRSPPAPPAAA